MKIRFLTTIVGPRVTFYAGQIVDVSTVPPELAPFLRPGRDGQRRAEVVVEDAAETATVEAPRHAVVRRGRKRVA